MLLLLDERTCPMDSKSPTIGGRKRSAFHWRICSILFLLHILLCLHMLPSEASSSDGPFRSIDGTSHVVSPDGQSGYSRIQTAQDEADSGDAVVLEKGVYVENLVVEKSIEILGESGNSGDTSIAAADPEKTVLSASRDGGLPVAIKLSGVSLRGGGGPAPVLICDSSAIFELENAAVCGPYSRTDEVPLRLEISSPVEGERFETDLVEVTGTVSRPEASVFVNGIAADAAGGSFSAQGLKLSPGSNTIAVLAQDGEDEAVATVEVELLAAVDLEPLRLAVSFSSDFDESLKVAGMATATVANNGNAGVSAPWRIVVFEDIDADGAFDGTADNVLGEETVSSGPKGGEAMDVAVEFAGGLLFRDSPIHAVADSEDAVEESDEGNNVAALRAVGVDLSASRLEIDDSACPDLAKLAVRIGNAGDALVAAGVPVAFHAGKPGDGGTLIGTTETSRELRPGAFQDVSFAWTGPFAEAASVHATADDDGTGSRVLAEADRENNLAFPQTAACASSPQSDGVFGKVVDAETGAFLAGAEVVLRESENGSPGAVVGQTVSDVGGGFLFPAPGPGEYVLVASMADYVAAESEIDLASGDSSIRRDIALSPILSPGEIRIVLTWGEHPADLEAHLTAPNPEGCRHHCFYWNKTIPGASLDLDDTRSYGPETVTISETATGTRRFYVHDFENRNSSTSRALAESGAEVAVYFGSGDPPRTFRVPDEAGTVWHVFNLDGDDGTVVSVDKITRQAYPGRIDFPEIVSSPLPAAVCGTRYIYQMQAEDPDLDVLVFGLVSGPDGMVLDPSTGLLEWTPRSDLGGRHDVEVRVSDGRCGEDSQFFQVNASYMPAVEFSVEPPSGMNPGGEITLAWRTERADSIAIDRGIGPVPAQGSMNLPSPVEPTMFAIAASNDAGRATATVPRPPRISQFSATCVSLSGGSAELNWSSDRAVECRIEPEIGSVGAEGSLTATPSRLPATYTLSCSNGAGECSETADVSECVPSADLKASADCGWAPGKPVVLSWTTGGVEDCSISPSVGPVPTTGSLEVVPLEEPASYTLSCAGAFDSVTVRNPRTMSLGATTYALLPGEGTSLVWNATCFDACAFDRGIGEVPCSGSTSVEPEQLPSTYTLTGSNDFGTQTKSVTLVHRRPDATFSASPATLKIGERATLAWTSNGAESCSIEPDIGQVPANGSIEVAAGRNTEYTLSATGPGGTTTRTATATYVKPTASIQAAPELLEEVGRSSTLTWVFSNADTCFVDQGIGEVEPGGSVAVSPMRTTIYTIIAAGPGGIAKDYATVAFVPPELDFAAIPEILDEGQTATLSWTVRNADDCAIDQGVGQVPPQGETTVDPEKTATYFLSAEGPGGRISESVTVTCMAPEVEISADPGSIEEGGSATLTWRVDHAAEQFVEPSAGPVEPKGSVEVWPTVTTTYTIAASGRGGTASAQAELVVLNPPSIAVVEPDGEDDFANAGFAIQWTDRDPDSDATISLFYDINDAGEDGVLIEAGIDETPDGPDDFHLWDTSEIPDGTYHVYATIDDGEHPPVSAYGGAVVVDHSVADEVKLLAGDGEPNDHFGSAVSIDGDYAVAGAPDTGEGGAVYVFHRQGASWVEQAKISLGDVYPAEQFGECVSIGGDTLAAGDPYGNEYKGAVYVFAREGSTWTLQARLVPPDCPAWGAFGQCVSIDGDFLVAGAPGHEQGAGAAYVFQRQGASWGDPAKLTGDEGAFGGNFGVSVSIDGDRLIAGSPYVSDATGAAFVFRLAESAWVREARLVPACSLEWGRFGSSVSISGDYAAVGNNGDAECGVEAAAFFFHYSGAAWEEQARIGSGAAGAGNSFGESVSIRGATAAAAEPDVWNDVGAVYLFERDGPQWTPPEAADPGEGEGEEGGWTEGGAEGEGEVQPEAPPSSGTFSKLTPGDGQAADRFGDSIDLDGGHAIVGAPSDDDNGSYSGSAYIYPLFFVRISVDPPYVQTGGEESATLSWTSRGADEVRIDPDIGTVPATGSLTIYPYETATYTITATRDGISIADAATVTAIDPSAEPTATLTATPEKIVRGEPALLSWTSANVDSVFLDNGIGEAPPTGSLVVRPAETTAYTATASNESGTATASVVITAVDPPPEVSFSAEPSEIEEGESATLSWTSEYAETLAIGPEIGTVEQNGSVTVSPIQTTAYTITATGSGGDTSSQATVVVRPPKPAISFSAAPSEIENGESATLTWSATNAEDASIDRGIGTVPLSGSKTVFPEADATYKLTAAGPGGVSTRSATVRVTPANGLQIQYPAEGDTIRHPDVLVRGIFSNSTGREKGISVNGRAALIYGNQFAANHVSLEEGWNDITAKAANADGDIREETVSVFMEMPEEYISLSSIDESGADSLETRLLVNGPLDHLTPSMKCDGPAEVLFGESSEENEYPVELNGEGLYFFTAEVVDGEAAIYSDSVAIAIISGEQLDSLLKAKWNDMKAALISGDIDAALRCHHERGYEKYKAIYEALGDKLPALVSQMQDISWVCYTDGCPEYRIRQDHDVNGQIVSITYHIHFSRGENGLWMIEEY